MNVTPGEVTVEPAENRAPAQPQPIPALGTIEPPLDDAAVREAVIAAERNHIDPQSLTMEALAQGPVSNPEPAPKPSVEVPQKFLKPDGVVDVEKIQASTKQLDEGIQKKEEAVSKTVDDYMREYNEKLKKFSSMPNAERVIAQAPRQEQPQRAPQGEVTPEQYEEIVRRDYAQDPLGTTTRLLNLMLEQRLAPIAEREKAEATRANLQALAQKDPRILREDVFAAVNAKLQSDPDYWKLKNPHKAAFLEVKEELRLGDPVQGQALPSRPAPVLGGGTPPSAPSVSVPSSQNILANLNAVDLRDKNQEAAADAAIREFLSRNRE